MSNVPKLRFKEFSGEWKVKKLNSMIGLQSGFAFKSENFSEEGNRLVIPKNFTKNGYGVFDEVNTKYTTEQCDEKYVCQVDDLLILLTDLTPSCELLGKPLLVKEEDGVLLLNQRIAKVLPTNNISVSFLQNFFLTSSYHIRIKNTATGSTVRHSSNKIILDTDIYLPTKQEQKKIASFLTLVDSKIEQLTKKEELLKQYKKGVMQQIFSKEIRFKADDGSEFEDWEEKKLGNILTQLTNGLSLSQNTENKGYKVSRIETISDATINIDKVGYVETEKDISDYRLELGDMLFSNINSVKHIGKIAFVDKEYDLYHGMNLLKLRVKKDNNPKYIYYVLTSRKYKNYFETICNQAVSQASINQTDLKKTKLKLPCLEEQTKIANFLSSIDSKIEQVQKQLDSTKEFKKALLQQMFV